MAKLKIYKKFSEVENELKRLGCKHVKLQNLEHQDIIAFNQPKKPVAPKIAEIKRKISVLPDGVYCIICQDRFGKNVHATNIYFGKGEYDNSISEEVKTHREETPSENLLSMDKAMEYVKENSELKAENTILKKQVEDLTRDLSEAEAEIVSLEQANEAILNEEPAHNPFSGLSEFMKELSPMIPGLADRWFESQKDNNDYKKAKLLLEHGYELPGAVKKANGAAGNGTTKTLNRVARPGTKQWPEYCQAVLDLSERDFQKHMALVKKQYPEIYEPLCAAVYEESGEEEEEEETDEN